MNSSLRDHLAGSLTIDLVVKIGAICVCLLDMVVFFFGLRQHWSVLSHSEQRLGVIILAMYPLPCLHFRKASKEQVSGALLVFMTYFLLGAATNLIFR